MPSVRLPKAAEFASKVISDIPPQTTFSGTIQGINGTYVKLDMGGLTLRVAVNGIASDWRTVWHVTGVVVYNYHPHFNSEFIIAD